jgi:hypothetical protein
MSWHPSHASDHAMDPAAPTRYRSAIVQSCAGRTMLVQTDDGDERLVPAPSTPMGSLVGARVLLAGDYDWVVAVDPTDPAEAVVIDLGSSASEPAEIDLRGVGTTAVVARPDRFGRRLARHLRRHRTPPTPRRLDLP